MGFFWKVVDKINFLKPYYCILRDTPVFRWFWFSTFVSLFGDWFNTIGGLTLLRLYSTSALSTALYFISRELPLILFSSIGGAFADRFNRRKIMVFADCARGVVVLAYLLIGSQKMLPLLFGLGFAQFSLSALFIPAINSSIPQIVRKEDLTIANMLDSITFSTLLFAGAAIGGLVAHFLGLRWNFIIDSASYFLSAACILMTLRYPLEPPALGIQHVPETLQLINHDDYDDDEIDTTQKSAQKDTFITTVQPPTTSSNLFTDVIKSLAQVYGHGFSYLWSHKFLLGISFAKALGAFVWSGQDPALVGLVTSPDYYLQPQGESFSLAVLWAASGLGVGIGPMVVGQFLPNSDKAARNLILFGFFIMTVGNFAQAILAGMRINFWLWILPNLVRTFGVGLIWIWSTSILQAKCDNDYLGRVSGVEATLWILLGNLSRLGSSAFIDYFHFGYVKTLLYWTGGAQTLILIIWTVFTTWSHISEPYASFGKRLSKDQLDAESEGSESVL